MGNCGCDIETLCRSQIVGVPDSHRINFCPLHAAAGEMRELLEAIIKKGNKDLYDEYFADEVYSLFPKIKDVLERTKG